ncbi:hypothetical protein FHR24_002439 [Wenyingzhuangia heitensis]|uniref:Phosphate-selective porin O and P n=1 Tax=Wenyingzhuangia heitensis TaxID=1487859 RepID=A0ABX0UB66_9FLAO|nr:hypothetical protein [Wenyingzhuangia heitensis]NIJ45968.1 hypothetical protein [Wenyingzhuangia heitensis]
MKTLHSLLIGIGVLTTSLVMAESPLKKNSKQSYQNPPKEVLMDTIKKEEIFKPSIHVGGIIHMYAGMQQKGYAFGGSPAATDASDWETDFTVYRGRVLIGAQLSKQGNFFMETELTTSVNGANDGTGNKSTRITPMILDAQYEHVFSDKFSVIGGLQLVSHNRNGIQGAASLMANDFTYYQYPYNLHPDSPLQNNLGRDLGVNFRGFFADEKLEYRLGFFSGRTSFAGTDESPIRTVGRLVYNVFDKDKSFYYSGTNLGKGKTLSIGAGIDTQGDYKAIGADVFLDMPAGDLGSITLNGAYSYLTGGNDLTSEYTFADKIPTQGTQYLELGYYFKESKLQPWLRYERQDMNSEDQQTGGLSTSDFDKYNSTTVLGGGLNYWFNGYNTNLRLSYTSTTKTFQDVSLNDQTKTYGQLWLQVQLFIF